MISKCHKNLKIWQYGENLNVDTNEDFRYRNSYIFIKKYLNMGKQILERWTAIANQLDILEFCMVKIEGGWDWTKIKQNVGI